TVTVDASALANNTQLILVGNDDFVVTGLKGDLDAHLLTGSLTVTTGNASDDSISVITGSSTTSITDASAGDTVSVDATALADGKTLTLAGAANFGVTALQGDLSASNSGTLSVTLADAATISITTTGGGTTGIDASALGNDHLLSLGGTDNSTVTGLTGDLDASGLTGTLGVTLADNAVDQDISVTTGSNTTTITGSSAVAPDHDTVTVDASALAKNTQLILVGSDDFIVTGLKGDLDAHLLTGTLTLTPGNASDDSISVITGSNVTSITDANAGDTVTVDATALVDGTLMTLAGAANFSVSALKGDLSASNSGPLAVSLADAATISITTTGGSTTSINATALANNHLLTVSGTDNTTVTGLTGDLVATGLS